MRRCIPWVAAGLILCLTAPVFSQSIFVWDKDHSKLFIDPEGAGQVDASYGVTKALTDCGYTFTSSTVLPSDLDPYDIIFVVMGVYC